MNENFITFRFFATPSNVMKNCFITFAFFGNVTKIKNYLNTRVLWGGRGGPPIEPAGAGGIAA
jgi:hypothetical protein